MSGGMTQPDTCYWICTTTDALGARPSATGLRSAVCRRAPAATLVTSYTLVAPEPAHPVDLRLAERAARIAPFATLLLTLLASPIAMAHRRTRYQVIEQDGAFELRDYAAYLVAETRVQASFEDAGNEAFRRLFRYISGDNCGAAEDRHDRARHAGQGREDRDDRAGHAGRRRRPLSGGLVVPSRYSASTVPKPLDPRIEIRNGARTAGCRLALLGTLDAGTLRPDGTALREAIVARGLRVNGPPVLARYDRRSCRGSCAATRC